MTTPISSTPLLVASSIRIWRADFCRRSRSTKVWGGIVRWPLPAEVMIALRIFMGVEYLRGGGIGQCAVCGATVSSPAAWAKGRQLEAGEVFQGQTRMSAPPAE